MEILPSLVLVVVLFPFLAMHFFNRPSSDDFSFAADAQEFGFWGAQATTYLSWSGRYFSDFLLAASPWILWHPWAYKTLTATLMIGIVGSVFWLCGRLFPEWGGFRKSAVAGLFLIVFFLEVPAPDQYFYWMTGALTYQMATILTVLFWGFGLEFSKTQKTHYLVICSLCVFGIVGSNETSLVLTDVILLSAMAFRLFQERKMDLSLCFLTILAFALTGVVLASPGNQHRSAFFPFKHDLNRTLILTFQFGSEYLLKWLRGIRGIFWIELFTLFFFLRGEREPMILQNKILKPRVVMALLLFLPFLGVLPAAWAMGEAPPDRAMSVVFFWFWGLFYFLILQGSFYFRRLMVGWSDRWILGFAWIFLILGLISIFAKPNSMTQAYGDILSGRAAFYDQQWESRWKVLKGSSQQPCLIAPFSEVPKTLYLEEITRDPKDWKNRAYSRFFRKQCVLLP